MIKTIIIIIVIIMFLIVPFIFSCADIAKKSDNLMDQVYSEYLKRKHEKELQQNQDDT